jgi:FMN phosphatase YigB (HAD superfamily)
LPVLDVLPPAKLETFIFDHAQLGRSLQIMPDCAPVLRECVRRGILLGIVSNAQAYTLREFRLALSHASLDPAIFQADLTFWSFQHGFSKPDPHVFQILGARLQNRGIEISAPSCSVTEQTTIFFLRGRRVENVAACRSPDGSSRGD